MKVCYICMYRVRALPLSKFNFQHISLHATGGSVAFSLVSYTSRCLRVTLIFEQFYLPFRANKKILENFCVRSPFSKSKSHSHNGSRLESLAVPDFLSSLLDMGILDKNEVVQNDNYNNLYLQSLSWK